MSTKNEEKYFLEYMQSSGAEQEIKKERNSGEIIIALGNLYAYAYLYGVSVSNGEDIDYPKVGKDKREMLADLRSKYGDQIAYIGSTMFQEAHDKGAKVIPLKDDPNLLQPPYYTINLQLREKYYYYSDYASKPKEVFLYNFISNFINDLNSTNNDSFIIKQTAKLKTAELAELIITPKWSESFIGNYVLKAYFNLMYLAYLRVYTTGGYDREDYCRKTIHNYNSILDGVKNALTKNGYSPEIIDFHLLFVKDCAKRAEKHSASDFIELMGILFNPREYSYNDESGIIKLETFISANLFG